MVDTGCEFRFLLEDPEVGAPELVVIDGAQLGPGDVEWRAGLGKPVRLVTTSCGRGLSVGTESFG
jgi:hypothetical protein